MPTAVSSNSRIVPSINREKSGEKKKEEEREERREDKKNDISKGSFSILFL